MAFEGGIEATNSEDQAALGLLRFWIDAGPERWFDRSDPFDTSCGDYLAMWEKAREGAFDAWTATAAGSLALIILLDQIPRNVFRGDPRQFAADGKALAVARRAVAKGHDRTQTWPMRNFFYLPFQHAEDVAAQEEGLDLYRHGAPQDIYYYALVHADAIRRFGRFPHRNAVLGRETTEAEKAYLASGGFGA
ncbi:DUF924 domain-containing protein [Acuticoccus sediminis]|uniref:DUF924 domain-containing protein n=1 Tax=Acuticoccus sediminis TaxID=2184697 RepID=A0A8B2NV00_9HYPH|nr:DUF924 family protein [Acuticoccus sediminis]RAI03173.1 DUF924 domain-containing protein [Acuticoccus sediminis]